MCLYFYILELDQCKDDLNIFFKTFKSHKYIFQKFLSHLLLKMKRDIEVLQGLIHTNYARCKIKDIRCKSILYMRAFCGRRLGLYNIQVKFGWTTSNNKKREDFPIFLNLNMDLFGLQHGFVSSNRQTKTKTLDFQINSE